MEKLTLRQILEDTSRVVISGNGESEKLLKDYKHRLSEGDEFKNEIKNAIIILERIIALENKIESKKSKGRLSNFRGKTYTIGLLLVCLVLVAGVYAGINYNVHGQNRLSVSANETVFMDGDGEIMFKIDSSGNLNISRNITISGAILTPTLLSTQIYADTINSNTINSNNVFFGSVSATNMTMTSITHMIGSYSNNEAYVCVNNGGTIYASDSACS